MGVKSLWTLLTPVGRPVMLETVEGKSMAIDSSIWIYQFQATMRDKDGKALLNAHVLGFLRRITKLLFYGIKPVFVFDGGAPALKRATLTERKRKKSGAAASHTKIAEKLLAAQLRREALNHTEGAQSSKAPKGKALALPPLDKNTVYLEDIDGSTPKTPSKRNIVTPSSSATKKNKFYDHDPYKLPEVDFEANIAKATRSNAPDPRLATEDELRTFIEEMRPEDFDINSPAFRELPTEIQYEIVGDLRLKSRQTSYARLQNMLKSAQTPLDFSKHQIKNLKQRNALTQQLLMTTDAIGSAHIAIPVRIASERNKEYILVKNEGEFGGWILGIKDTGTREKPIIIDHDEVKSDKDENEESDMDMEEVEIPVLAAPDPDLREYQREMALSAISNRTTSKILRPLTTKIMDRKSKRVPLFDSDESLEEQPVLHDSEANDEVMVAHAVQESFDQSNLTKNMASTCEEKPTSYRTRPVSTSRYSSPEDDFYMDYPAPTPLETALSIANAAGPSPIQSSPSKPLPVFGKPTLLAGPSKQLQIPTSLSSSDDEIEVVATSNVRNERNFLPGLLQRSEILRPVTPEQTVSSLAVPMSIEETDSDDDVEEVPVQAISLQNAMHDKTPVTIASLRADKSPSPSLPLFLPTEEVQDTPPFQGPVIIPQDNLNHDPLFIISRTPSPSHELPDLRPPSPPIGEDWDAAEEMDVQAEEGEFARFISQVKGKDLGSVRKEIDDEIKALNEQRKAAMRDSEDITQQVVSQIMTMLRFFGIPYITAPMEAEAQCAELLALGLVDGVITDDSDVFLFGAQRVYKNMFNQSKTVECFLLSDLSRELGLDRNTLIQLAYLLGSDYTEGLPGIGPVVAMELLKEFPGHNGLHKFREWWTKVQSGKDKEEDSQSKFRKQFKKRFKDLYLASNWPDSVVRDAYYHPIVDSSEEPFKWGLPDLDGLREFLHRELGWQQLKVDELLLPIIQRMNKRGQAAALNRQGNLNEFLDISAGSGTHAPKKSRAYESKRLQQVISEFRKKRRNGGSNTPIPTSQSGDGNSQGESEEVEEVTSRKRQRKSLTTTGERAEKKGRATVSNANREKGKFGASSDVRGNGGRGRGRGRGAGRTRARKSKVQELSSEPSEEDIDEDRDSDDVFMPGPAKDAIAVETGEVTLRPRPRPRPTYKGVRSSAGKVTGAEVPTLNVDNATPDVPLDAAMED